jgi:tRNA nucleotidyltransferase/poly(A) polymerase
VNTALEAARRSLRGPRAWIVGGALRDRALGRDSDDVDLVVEGDVRLTARTLAGQVRGAAFPLSESFGAWRVIGPDRRWQADLTPLAGNGIEHDLSKRDFTVNAMAEPLEGGELIDPFDGSADLEAGRLRMVSPEAFDDDPLRVLRLARLACELGLEPEGMTAAEARTRAERLREVASERVFAELKRVVVAPAAVAGIRLMDDLGALEAVLPELTALKGVEQSTYHHLDVYEHTIAVLEATIELERDSSPLGEHAAAVRAHLEAPLADELTRGQALRFGALLHDAAKPQTRGVLPGGRVTFLGHDAAGADLSRAVLKRLHSSERLRSTVAALTRHHLRLGFLVHQRPLPDRTVYAYLTECSPVEIDVTVLSVADRLATRGRKADVAIQRHLDLAAEMLGEALRRQDLLAEGPLVRGDELARELGIDPGPRLGTLIERLQEARFAGEIATRDEAVDLARSLAAAG